MVDPDEIDETINTNFVGAVHVLRAVCAGMVARQRGHIVNVAERVDTHAQRFLLLEVVAPLALTLRQVGLSAREERATRGPEPIPHLALILPGCGTERLPLRLQRGEPRRGLDPVCRLAQPFGLGYECQAPLTILFTLGLLGGKKGSKKSKATGAVRMRGRRRRAD